MLSLFPFHHFFFYPGVCGCCFHGSVPGVSGDVATGVGGVRADARAARIERPKTPLPVLPGARVDAAGSSAAGWGAGTSASALTILCQLQQQHT